MSVGTGNGTTVVFGTSLFAGLVTSIDGFSLTRGWVNSSNMATTADHTGLPDDLSQVESLTYSGHHSGDLDPPITGGTALETVTVDWAGEGGGNTWAALGAMTAFSASAPMGDMMTFTATVNFSGPLSVA